MPVATTAARAAQFCPCGGSPVHRRCPSPPVLKYKDWNPGLSPDRTLLHQRMQRASLSSSLTSFPLALYILVGVNCFSKIILSYLFGDNVSGHYLTLEERIRGRSDLSLS